MPRRLRAPTPPLQDDVIRLEPLDERFVPGFAQLIADPDVLRFTRVPDNPPDGFAATWIGHYTKAWADGSRAGFAIVDAQDDTFLGMAALVRIDWEAEDAELGYIVVPGARGRGLAGRAIRVLSEWALGPLGLARLEAWIDVANEPSLRVAERAGWNFEGVKRSVHVKEGLRADMAIYSLLAGELSA